MEYWIFGLANENVLAPDENVLTVHHRDCARCPISIKTLVSDPQWIGPFGNRDEALQMGMRLNRPIQYHFCCSQGIAIVGPSALVTSTKELEAWSFEAIEAEFHVQLSQRYGLLRNRTIGAAAARHLVAIRNWGAVEFARNQLRPGRSTTILDHLAMRHEEDNSLEALVLRNPFSRLFGEPQLNEARRRLRKVADDFGVQALSS